MTDTPNTDGADGQSDDQGDPTSLALPRVETGLHIGDYRARDGAYAAPGTALGLASGSAGLAGAIDPGIAMIGTGAAAMLAGGGLAFASRTPSETTPLDRLRAPIRSRRQQRPLPLTPQDQAEAALHGVRRIRADGIAEMADGRYVGLLRLSGRNTDLQDPDERTRMVASLGGRIDEKLADSLGASGFRIHTATTRFDPEDVTEKYQAAAFGKDYAGDEWAIARELLLSLSEWHAEVAPEGWGARNHRRYLVVSVEPWEVDAPNPGVGGSKDGLRDRVTGLWGAGEGSDGDGDGDGLTPAEAAAEANPLPGAAELTERASRRILRERMTAEVEERLDRLTKVFGGTPGVDVERVHGGEHAVLAARYWSGTGYGHGFDGVEEMRADRLAELIAAPEYDADTGERAVRLGDHYARTYWIAEWPSRPEATFLRELYTATEVDVDVTIHVRPREKETTKHQLKHTLSNLDVDLDELDKQADYEAISVSDDQETYFDAYRLLATTDAEPWDVNGYITVRASHRDALDRAQKEAAQAAREEASLAGSGSGSGSGTGQDGDEHPAQVVEAGMLDLARLEELEDAAQDVREVAEGSPADLALLSPSERQHDLYQSGAPTGRDVYDRASHADRSTLMLGGAVAALTPAVSRLHRDPGGIEWGRSHLTGASVVKDPFNAGGPGHALFVGDSGSGKTYQVLKLALRWWLADSSRTLVLCDTFGDFADITRVLNGDHVVLGGDRVVNPMHIEPTPQRHRNTGIDPFGMAVDEVATFLDGVIRSQGDGSPPSAMEATLITEVAERTYRGAGITRDDYDSHARPSPTMADYRDELSRVAEDPSLVAISEAKGERDLVGDLAVKLLRKLSGFKDDGTLGHLVGESDVQIRPGGISYLDLQQAEERGAVDQTTMLQLMLGKVYQAAKRSPGETVFLLDEAHYLLQSQKTIDFLQRAARHWRHYNAGVWYASQRPKEFISDPGDEDGHQNTIRTQATTVHMTQTDDINDEAAQAFDLNDRHRGFISRADRGDAGQGYSDALVSFDDSEGWERIRIEVSGAEADLLGYPPDPPEELSEAEQEAWEPPELEAYLAQRWEGLDVPAPDRDRSAGLDPDPADAEPGHAPGPAAPDGGESR